MQRCYRFTVEPLGQTAPLTEEGPLTFDLDMHDDLARVLGLAQTGAVVPDEEVLPFIVGLKLFSESFLKHRKEEPFASLAPHFGAFMKAVKSRAKGRPTPRGT